MLAAELTDNQSEIWRVSWNVTGTILASSGDDGRVLLWKSSFSGEWNKVLDATSISSNANVTAAPLPKERLPETPVAGMGTPLSAEGNLKGSHSDNNLALKYNLADSKADY
jgi:WD40 repeat protein